MYLNSILYFWGMSEELPVLFGPETQERFDWCFSQALKRREDFVAMLLDKVVIAEPAVAKRPAPSIITSPPKGRRKPAPSLSSNNGPRWEPRVFK
jgi:hypothetical protein